MMFFLYSLLRRSVVGYKPLYFLLISTFVFTLFKIIFEWYHYWSIKVPELPNTSKNYSVDIFTTFCAGEPYDMIVDTLTAIQAITYPHKTFLCDEADDAYLKGVCEKLGIVHITRQVKIDAKAGNINNALRSSSGELCVILDPDHRPQPNMLDPIVGHFDDLGVGFVQIVQAYHNQNTGWVAKGASQQTYQFYGPMMMCMNSYGTVQAIGANCTFRRSALDSIGGHAAGLAEDMHTAMQLHAKGWRSVYVPAVVTHGLVPATMSAYFKQQLKWSRGVFELMLTSYIKLFNKFDLRQKLHYGLMPLFYMSGFVFLFNFLIPIVSLLASVYPLKMDFSQFVIISTPFITSVILVRHYVQRWVMDEQERGFHVIGGLLLIGTWWVFITGFIYTLIRKNVPYIPTPKDLSEEKNLKINLPNVIVLVLSVSAIWYGLINDRNPFTFLMAGMAGLNCLFMTFMILAAEQFKLRRIARKLTYLNGLQALIKELKGRFWIFRRKLYSGVRSLSLMLTVLTICVCIYFSMDNTGTAYDYPLYNKQYELANGYPLDVKTKLNEAVPAASLAIRSLNPNAFLSTKGVIYSKGSFWYKNTYPLTKKIILKDINEVRNAGINTIKIYGPNVYDNSILEAARTNSIKVHYSFWMPDPKTFLTESDKWTDLSSAILETVEKLKDSQEITSWNIGNYPFQLLDKYYSGSDLVKARSLYVAWLKQLVQKIKTSDPRRTITVDALSCTSLTATVTLFHQQIPAINAFGLILPNSASVQILNKVLDVPYFFSSAYPTVFENGQYPAGGIFYANWQDQEAASTVAFDGLKDKWGRIKPFFASISRIWKGHVPDHDVPAIKILRPAVTTDIGSKLTYAALIFRQNKWDLTKPEEKGLTFDWYMVRTDQWGNALSMKKIGSGTKTEVTIPSDHQYFRLYLVAFNDKNNSTSDLTTLNTPLIN
ncbi:glycosyltransferase family 2 protein [Mucilaginibacter myungsuensis]|nr:glycosyltransferase family 2 protein [Mucilaginibacter myungsuensis]